jgi:predicted ribonuclease YlaK
MRPAGSARSRPSSRDTGWPPRARRSTGLTIAADKFRGEKLAGHIVLGKGERSELAELAANLL